MDSSMNSCKGAENGDNSSKEQTHLTDNVAVDIGKISIRSQSVMINENPQTISKDNDCGIIDAVTDTASNSNANEALKCLSNDVNLISDKTEKVSEQSLNNTTLNSSENNTLPTEEKNANVNADDLQAVTPCDKYSIIPAVDTTMSQMKSSAVLQALGLTRGLGMGFTNTINLKTNNLSILGSEGGNKLTGVPLTSGGSCNTAPIATKTVPLLVNMKGNGSGAPSILPANLPPGRYVIISSTTAANATSPLTTTTTTSAALTTTATTTTTSTLNNSIPLRIVTSNHNLSVPDASSARNTTTRFSLVRNVTTFNSPHGMRTPVGKTRGMRKSYTTSEKLAMIEAVESGLKKSVVADAFGVAPSTLACIILQKDKIRRDQSKSSLNRRRLRPSSGRGAGHRSSSSPKRRLTTDEGHCSVRLMEAISPLETGTSPTGASVQEPNTPPPFTHFLANFDQSVAFDNPPEEIVSVPDLSESMSYSTPDNIQPRLAGENDNTSTGRSQAKDHLTSPREGEKEVPDVPEDGEEECEEIEGEDNNSPESCSIVDSCDVDDCAATQPHNCHVNPPAGAVTGLSGLCLVKREVHCYSVLDQLMKDLTYTDVTLTTDGHTFHAHKIVLCIASSYFRRVLSDNSPGVRNVVVLRDIHHQEMKNILQFLYTGEATVDASELQSFMRTAQQLEINSLCDVDPISVPSSSSGNLSTDASSISPSIVQSHGRSIEISSTQNLKRNRAQYPKHSQKNNEGNILQNMDDPLEIQQYVERHIKRQVRLNIPNVDESNSKCNPISDTLHSETDSNFMNPKLEFSEEIVKVTKIPEDYFLPNVLNDRCDMINNIRVKLEDENDSPSDNKPPDCPVDPLSSDENTKNNECQFANQRKRILHDSEDQTMNEMNSEKKTKYLKITKTSTIKETGLNGAPETNDSVLIGSISEQVNK